MLHIVPILCLLFFIWMIEIRLKREMHEIEKNFIELKKSIKNNSEKIEQNRVNIEKSNG